MGAVYAAVNDVMAVGRALTNQQSEAAVSLLEQASARLRLAVRQVTLHPGFIIAPERSRLISLKASSG